MLIGIQAYLESVAIEAGVATRQWPSDDQAMTPIFNTSIVLICSFFLLQLPAGRLWCLSRRILSLARLIDRWDYRFNRWIGWLVWLTKDAEINGKIVFHRPFDDWMVKEKVKGEHMDITHTGESSDDSLQQTRCMKPILIQSYQKKKMLTMCTPHTEHKGRDREDQFRTRTIRHLQQSEVCV